MTHRALASTDEYLKAVTVILREMRGEHSLRELAARVPSASYSMINRMEKGETPIRLDLLLDIASACDVVVTLTFSQRKEAFWLAWFDGIQTALQADDMSAVFEAIQAARDWVKITQKDATP